MTTYNGKCHCGETEWTAKLNDASHIICHCIACKLLSGGESTLNQVIDKSDFNLTKGNLKMYTYKGDSGNDVNCYYCPNCTSHPYHHQTVLGDKLIIRTTMLEGSKSFPVAAEIYGKDKAEWQPAIAEKVFNAGPE